MSAVSLFDEGPLDVLSVSLACMKPSVPLVFSYAGVDRGRRMISASLLDHAGRIGACRFFGLRATATEWQPWKGEPHVHAERRLDPSASWHWGGLTEAAAHLFDAELGRVLAGEGFDRAWRAARHTVKGMAYIGGGAATQRATLLAEAAWWAEVDRICELAEADPDAISYRPVEHPEYRHPIRHLRPESSARGRGYVQLLASVWMHGEQIGWVGADGHWLPLQPLSN